MKVALIKIEQILGIEHLEIKPGLLTVISGKNETGKTSVLEAIKSVTTGGKDGTLLRQGAEKGSVVLVFDDGTEATRKVTQKTDTVSVTKDGFRSTTPAPTSAD